MVTSNNSPSGVLSSVPNSSSSHESIIHLLTPYWDSHMIFPVIDWMARKKVYSPEVMENLRADIKSRIQSSENSASSSEVNEEIKILESEILSLKMALEGYKKSQVNRISGSPERKSLIELSEWWIKEGQHALTSATLTAEDRELLTSQHAPFPKSVDVKVLRLAKLKYSQCNYLESKEILDYFLQYVSEFTIEGNDIHKRIICYWGIAACVIVSGGSEMPTEETKMKEMMKPSCEELLPELSNPDTKENKTSMEMEVATHCLLKLGEMLDSISSNSSGSQNLSTIVLSREESMLFRSFIIHWFLFPYFLYYLSLLHVKGVFPKKQAWGLLVEWFFNERNLAVIHLVCPHMLRYCAVYAILTRKRKDHFQSVIAAIGNAKSKYSDPFTLLLEALFVDFDFEAAQKHITQIGKACSHDFFLEPLKKSIEDNARLIIFETYCRIHKSINVDMIARQLNMSPEVAERWIVNLIRNARLDARIDSDKNRVEMTTQPPNLYHQVIEKTRNITIRSTQLYQNINRPLVGKDGDDAILTGGRNDKRGRGKLWNRGGRNDNSRRNFDYDDNSNFYGSNHRGRGGNYKQRGRGDQRSHEYDI